MMKLPQEQKSILQKNIKLAFDNDYEFEIIFKSNKIQANGFQRMLTYLYNHYDFKDDINRKQLDVSMNQFRLSIFGQNEILSYCKYQRVHIDKSILIRKNRVDKLDVSDYDFRINLNNEETITNENEIKSFHKGLKSALKNFRYKERWTFVDKKKTHRIDMTIVKQSNEKKRSLAESGTLTNNEHLEVEIEYLNKSTSSPDDCLGEMLLTTNELLKKNLNQEFILSNREITTIKMEYVNLIDSKVTIDDVEKSSYKYVLGYKPITLVRKNLLEDDVDVVSIWKDYSVTAKADGERYSVFISKTGDVYMIDSRFTIKSLGIKLSNVSSCILDGEYITQGKLLKKLSRMLFFDLYFINGKDVRTQSLEERQKYISKEVLNDLASVKNTKYSFELKKFYLNPETIFKDTSKLFKEMNAMDYHTDGLIYTPLYLAPGAIYKNEHEIHENKMNPFGGTWTKVFKWKPPDQNSIDVLLSFGSDIDITDEKGMSITCKYTEMYVAYKGTVEPELDIFETLTYLDDISKKKKVQNKQVTGRKMFKVVYLPVPIGKTLPFTEEGEEIKNDIIVEMRYTGNIIQEWSPMRIRRDKTELYRNNGKIEGAANMYNPTVENVLVSIKEPITPEMLIGKLDSLNAEEIKQNEKYYIGEIERKRSLLMSMRDFHNRYVKRTHQFGLFHGRNMRLLDIGCGEGGDLAKWIDNGFTTIVGVDNNYNNIVNSKQGALKRLSNAVENNFKTYDSNVKINLNKQHVIFLLLNGGMKWGDEKMFENISNDNFKFITEIAWGKIDKAKLPNDILKNSHNVMNVPFNVISCQFAVHYFFETMDTLKNFCWNVNEHLAPNGYFIGTALDGSLVNNAFTESKTDTLKGIMNESVLWQIEKKFDVFTSNSIGYENIGKQIDVYVESIGQIIPEYLIDFHLLERELEQYKIRLVKIEDETDIKFPIQYPTGSFELLWNNMVEHYNKKKSHNYEQMNDNIKTYSFLNRWFVFKKYT